MRKDSTPGLRRARACVAALAGFFCLVAAYESALAARVVRVYEVEVRNADSPAALQDALRQVLVRATGRRDAGSDPALAGIVGDAQRYVASFRPGASGNTVVVFDGARIESEITAAGRSVWEAERPFVIVVLSPPPAPAAADSVRRTLEQAAAIRGLPITQAPLPLTDELGVELDRAALLQSARRLGGDAVLVGRGDNAALNGEWQWTLHTAFSTESWTGPLDAGVHGAADAFARVNDGTMSPGEEPALVRIEGVATLADYASVVRLLDSLSGVRQVSMEEAAGSVVTFRVLARGGAQRVIQALSGASQLAPASTSGALLMYRLRQ